MDPQPRDTAHDTHYRLPFAACSARPSELDPAAPVGTHQGAIPRCASPHRVWRSVAHRFPAPVSPEKLGTTLYGCRTPQLTAAGGGGWRRLFYRRLPPEPATHTEATGWRSLNSAPSASASPARRFYDLTKIPAVCPKCATEQPIEQPRPRRTGGNVAEEKRPKKPVPAPGLEEADIEVEGVEEEAEEDVLEDATTSGDADTWGRTSRWNPIWTRRSGSGPANPVYPPTRPARCRERWPGQARPGRLRWPGRKARHAGLPGPPRPARHQACHGRDPGPALIASPKPSEPGAGRDRRRQCHAVDHQRRAECGEHPPERAGQAQREPAAADGDQQPQQAGEQRPEQPARALRGEIERQAEPEEPIELARPIADTRLPVCQHARIVAEQPEPGVRPDRGGHADRLGQRERERAADQRDAQRARPLARRRYWCRPAPPAARRGRTPAGSADIPAGRRCHSRRSRRARRPAPTSAVVSAIGQRGLQRADRADRADPQDVEEQRPAQRAPAAGATRLRPDRMYQPSTAAVSAVVNDNGRRRRRRCRAPETGRCRRSGRATAAPATRRRCRSPSAGTNMLPVPRITLASAFISHTSAVPANTTLE